MAIIKCIFLKEDKPALRLQINIRPNGETWLDVPLPKDFYGCIMQMAQAAADQLEQEMRAQILADSRKEDAA